jgi:hypothetical protein
MPTHGPWVDNPTLSFDPNPASQSSLCGILDSHPNVGSYGDSPGAQMIPSPKACGMAQVIECLPSQCETLSSNPTATKKKKKKNVHLQMHVARASGSCL